MPRTHQSDATPQNDVWHASGEHQRREPMSHRHQGRRDGNHETRAEEARVSWTRAATGHPGAPGSQRQGRCEVGGLLPALPVDDHEEDADERAEHGRGAARTVEEAVGHVEHDSCRSRRAPSGSRHRSIGSAVSRHSSHGTTRTMVRGGTSPDGGGRLRRHDRVPDGRVAGDTTANRISTAREVRS